MCKCGMKNCNCCSDGKKDQHKERPAGSGSHRPGGNDNRDRNNGNRERENGNRERENDKKKW